MSERKFSSLLSVLVPSIIGLIVERKGVTEIDASAAFYRSKTYSLLSNEATKFWHYSAETLYSMYDDEVSGREISFPEEAC